MDPQWAEEAAYMIRMGLLTGQALRDGHPYAPHLSAVGGRLAFELDNRDRLKAALVRLQEAHRAGARHIAQMKRDIRRADNTAAMLAERQRRIVAKL